jgi:hypothetical protein
MGERFSLDFGVCLGGAYRALVQYFGTFLVLVAGWFALGIAVWILSQAAFMAALTEFPAFGEAVATWDERVAVMVMLIPFAVVAVFGTVSMVVGWHRRIIRGEVPMTPFPTGMGAIFAYLGRGILAFGIPFVPLFALLAIGGIVARDLWGPDATRSGLLILPIVVSFIAATAVAMRFGIVLPAVAVGDRTMTLTRAWQITRGNTVKLLIGAFLAALPFSIAGNILEKLLEVPSIVATEWAVALIFAGIVVEMMNYASVAGFFSLAYMQFAEALRDGEGAP